MNGWKNDKRWSDKFLPEIKQILGLHLIGEPPVEEDQERNTDLIVLKMEAVRIACRVRRNEFMRYKDEFTVRSSRPSGIKTELKKIVEGWGDYLFYGISEKEEEKLEHYILGDLKFFRAYFVDYLSAHGAGQLPGVRKENLDGSSAFYCFKYKDIPDFVIHLCNKEERR